MSAVAIPKPWPLVPNTLTAAQLLDRLETPRAFDPSAEEQIKVFLLRSPRGHVMEILAGSRDAATAARSAGGQYVRTIIRRKQAAGRVR